MKHFFLACLFVLMATVVQAQTTDQARRTSAAGADRWVFWTKLNNVQAGLARETGRPVPQFNQGNFTRSRRGFFRRRR